jgi:hypothetical protein
VWTQGLELAEQGLYHLSPASSPKSELSLFQIQISAMRAEKQL